MIQFQNIVDWCAQLDRDLFLLDDSEGGPFTTKEEALKSGITEDEYQNNENNKKEKSNE